MPRNRAETVGAGEGLLCDGDSHRASVILRRTGRAKANPVEGHFYLFRGEKPHRHRKNLRAKQILSSLSLKHSKREKEAGFIISSLPTDADTAKQIITLYKIRLQIEAAFRDLKNTRNGFS